MKFINKDKIHIYLSPYTPMTKGLERYLKEVHTISIKGYIDNSKQGKNIHSPLDIENLLIDRIFILSPNWMKDIHDNLNKFINTNKLTVITKDKDRYKKSIFNIKFIRIIDKVLIKIINTLFKYFDIKITRLWTNRIGEFCLENEAFLNKIIFDDLYKNQKYLLLSYLDKDDIANKTLYYLYKVAFKKNKNIFILENNFLNKYLRFSLNNKSIQDRHHCNIEQKSNDYELFTNKEPIIHFNQRDVIRGNQTLKKLEIEKPYVCIFARDSQYLDNTFTYHDWTYHDYRDSDIDTYSLAIEYLIDNGYTVIRIGSTVSKELTFKHSKCIDYPYSKFRSEFMDIFLLSQCSFAMGGHSGILDICNAFGKVRLGINNMPIDAPTYSTKKDIYIPKKLKLNGKYISLNKYFEIINNSNLSHFDAQTYKKLNLKIEENTPLEILMLVKEYLGDYKANGEDNINLKKYYKSHSKSKQFSNVKTKISTQFLRANPWFISD